MNRPLTLLISAFGVFLVGQLLGLFLYAQDYTLAAGAVSVLATLASLALFVLLLVRHQNKPWVSITGNYAGGLAIAALAANTCLLFNWTQGIEIVIGFYAMALTFFLGVHLIRFILRPGHPILGIARTLIDESIRMRVPLVFLILLLLLVPSLPLVMDPAERLEYRVASFLSWAMLATSGLLSLLTIFLAVGTIATEFGQKYIFMTLTKPVSRWQYLLGKWLGIILLNALLVTISGTGIYTFTRIVAAQPALDAADRAGVDTQVLASRIAIQPQMASPERVNNLFARQLLRLQAEDPGTYGQPFDPNDPQAYLQARNRLSPQAQNAIVNIVVGEWYSVAPRNSETYRFTGLQRAKQLGGNIQFRVEPKTSSVAAGGMIEFAMRINDRIYASSVFPDGRIRLSRETHHVLDIPTQAIDDDGTLKLEIFNNTAPQQGTLSFSPSDGMELLYRVDTFENNFLRSMLLLWTRLAFITMASLAAASFLGFPVACLLALLIYFGAATSQFLDEALVWFSDKPPSDATFVQALIWHPVTIVSKLAAGEVVDAIKIVIRAIGLCFMALIPSFADYTANEAIAKGLHISWNTVIQAFAWVSGIWTFVVFLIGYLMLRKREPAEIIV